MFKFPHYSQPDIMDCGPTCLRIVSKHFGKDYSLPFLRNLTFTTREGSSMMGISKAAEQIGFRTIGVKVDYKKLEEEKPFPCIAHWRESHFVVVYKIKNNKVYVSDPAHGLITYSKEEFLKNWISQEATETTEEGILLLLETSPNFHKVKLDDESPAQGLSFLTGYLTKYKKLLIQLALGLTAGSILQLIVPFLTQSVKI